MSNLNPALARESKEHAEHGWRERRDFHPSDQKLRHAGFVIHARPKNGPALWTHAKHKMPVTAAEAMKLVEGGLE
jgi:hypothetical protein